MSSRYLSRLRRKLFQSAKGTDPKMIWIHPNGTIPRSPKKSLAEPRHFILFSESMHTHWLSSAITSVRTLVVLSTRLLPGTFSASGGSQHTRHTGDSMAAERQSRQSARKNEARTHGPIIARQSFTRRWQDTVVIDRSFLSGVVLEMPRPGPAG